LEGRSYYSISKDSIHSDLITQLQVLHDDTPVKLWYDNLKEIALNYNLEFNLKQNTL